MLSVGDPVGNHNGTTDPTKLPPRPVKDGKETGKTQGVQVTTIGTKKTNVSIISGVDGPGKPHKLPTGTGTTTIGGKTYNTNSAINSALEHVEGHAVGNMIDTGATTSDIHINNSDGPCFLCKNFLPLVLPKGSTLNVHWTDKTGKKNTFPIDGKK